MSELIISVSGLRGIIGENLTPDVAVRYVAAFAGSLQPGPIVVARDGRTTGAMIRDAVISSLVACGREVIDVGIAATPSVGVFVRASQAAGAVQISASHNPPEYNGIKLFSAGGRVIGAAEGAAVKERYLANQPAWQTFDKLGSVSRIADPHIDHLETVLQTVDVAAIRAKGFRVLLDSNHGAGGLLGLRLLEELGCTVMLCGTVPDGLFAHPPEPTAENLTPIAAQVAAQNCDVGFCQDPDADRLALIDAQGRYIGEEYTVALCVQRRLMQAVAANESSGPIVINCATSSMSDWLAQQAGVPCLRSAVGEANVADTMLASQAIYGGEGNGGPIDPRVGYVRDSFVAMAQVLDLMAASGKSISELVTAIPSFAIHKTKVEIETSLLPQIFDKLQHQFADAKADRLDGLRLTWEDSWLLVRGSNTEPIVRLIAEAPSESAAATLCDQAAKVIASC
ncbi:phosphoglucosamine mutase [Planctomycetaceae bacterium SH139]